MATATEADSLSEFDPNWCLFWGQAVTGFDLDIWVPYLRASRYRYAIMAGQNHFSDGVRERVASLPNVCIVEPFEEARSWLKAAPNFKGFLYIGDKAGELPHGQQLRRKLHIWLGHGESDKIYNAFRTASLYDSMFVARYGVVKRDPRAVRRWVGAGRARHRDPDRGRPGQAPLGSPAADPHDPVRPHLGGRLDKGSITRPCRSSARRCRGAAGPYRAGGLGDHAAAPDHRTAPDGAHRTA